MADHATVMQRGAAYLRSQQDAESGGWSVQARGPNFPAITGLALIGLLDTPGITQDDEAVARAVKYILNCQQPNGGIYLGLLPSYNTAICLTALSKVSSPQQVVEARARALAFLRTLQWSEDAVDYGPGTDTAGKVDPSHPFYGGVGYGRHGRPDLSNTAFFVEALHAAGVAPDDPAMKRAMVFLQRTQMLERVQGDAGHISVNDMAYAKGSRQGGFIYATSENRDSLGLGQSFAGSINETLSDGTVASRLRSYGSMTYSGFKSYLYAGLNPQDHRVLAARGWISRNYTLQENPGVGSDGLYYYYVVFGRALAALGHQHIEIPGPVAGESVLRDWAADLTRQLASLQEDDGSFRVVDDRWMEDNKVLITAYALTALGAARTTK
jgi:squalene-hopene/tetraprenyl-beta-curcumene cyclase